MTHSSRTSLLNFTPHHVFPLPHGFSNAAGTSLAPGSHSRLPLSARVPTVLSYHSTGISTCCPSATTLVLTLGPDLPRADQLYSGNLRYSAERIPTFLSLLIPAFSLPCSPQLLTVLLRPACNAPLPILSDPLVSVVRFSPGHFRRRTARPVSYYALFE